MRRIALIAATVGVVLWGLANQTQAFHSDRDCNRCHVPHRAVGDNTQVPLWSPDHTTTSLTNYYTNASGTLDATMGVVDGASKLCLSCHDGTYPRVNQTKTTKFGGDGHMGELTHNHPLSFEYNLALATADGALEDPAVLAKDILDGQGKMQCTSCHDIHATADPSTPYLRWAYDVANDPTTTAAFCRHCHKK